MDIKVEVAQLKDAEQVALLQYYAFINKFRAMVKNKDTHIKDFMTEYYNITLKEPKSNLYVFKRNDTVLGLLSIAGKDVPKETGFPSVGYLFKSVKNLGLINSLKFFLGLTVLDSKPANNMNSYIATIAVSEKHRGKGVGTMILEFAQHLAIEKGFNGLTLYVTTDNAGAIRVYERFGFSILKEEKSRFFKSLIGVNSFYYMFKEV